VKAALERIDGDEFGYCDVCGEEIAPARLENNPAVTSCIGCAS
jgi:DnaK suppressor protein